MAARRRQSEGPPGRPHIMDDAELVAGLVLDGRPTSSLYRQSSSAPPPRARGVLDDAAPDGPFGGVLGHVSPLEDHRDVVADAWTRPMPTLPGRSPSVTASRRDRRGEVPRPARPRRLPPCTASTPPTRRSAPVRRSPEARTAAIAPALEASRDGAATLRAGFVRHLKQPASMAFTV